MAASPYSIQGVPRRAHVLKNTAERWGLPVVYVNQVGARADLIFDGGTSVTLPGQEAQALCPNFVESCALWDTDLKQCLQTMGLDGTILDLSSAVDVAGPKQDPGHQVPGLRAVGNQVLGHRFDAAEITEALCLGIKDYLAMTGGQTVVVGVS